MELLDVLDHHYKGGATSGKEFEYRLLSWGEIFPPFFGDRDHSIYARFILDSLPFRLFSVSAPYSEPPQKLCLTFKAPQIERKTATTTSIGYNPDKIAREFTAFLSLYTRRRIFPVGLTREDGLPIERDFNIYMRSHSQEIQQQKEIKQQDVYRLMGNLQKLDRPIAHRFILSMHLYHSAIEMMYSEPEFAYLFLVNSLEAIASAVYTDLRPQDQGDGRTELDDYLDSAYPGWRNNCDISSPKKRRAVVDMLLTKAYLVRRKFKKFVEQNLPDKFWDEDEDDAKPSCLYHSCKTLTLQPYEKIEKTNLKRTLDKIYDARSKFIHKGARFPASIAIGHCLFIPVEAVTEVIGKIKSNSNKFASEENFLDVPPLLTFEKLVSYTLMNFLNNQGNA